MELIFTICVPTVYVIKFIKIWNTIMSILQLLIFWIILSAIINMMTQGTNELQTKVREILQILCFRSRTTRRRDKPNVWPLLSKKYTGFANENQNV